MNSLPTAPVHTAPPEDPIHTLLRYPSGMGIDLTESTLPSRERFSPTLEIDDAAFKTDWPVCALGPTLSLPIPPRGIFTRRSIHTSNRQSSYPPGVPETFPVQRRWIDYFPGSTFFNGVKVEMPGGSRLEVQFRQQRRGPEIHGTDIRVSLALLPRMNNILLEAGGLGIDFALTVVDLRRRTKAAVRAAFPVNWLAFEPRVEVAVLRILDPSKPGTGLTRTGWECPAGNCGIFTLLERVWLLLHTIDPSTNSRGFNALKGATILESIQATRVERSGWHIFDIKFRQLPPAANGLLSPLITLLEDSEELPEDMS
ncbi:hypothetical protein C8R46DRAFT_1037720 [Mycena filopes]|nr:hypothetical protein C8R46DRAFT_1037720 [Mycena filopes]